MRYNFYLFHAFLEERSHVQGKNITHFTINKIMQILNIF
jgi:hypothetical protein